MKAAKEILTLARPLQAFWIDEDTVYAAFDAQGAVQLANAEYGYGCFTLQEVMPCDRAVLDGPAYSPAGRLFEWRGLLNDRRAPGHLPMGQP